MHILAIVGSYRKKGNTARIVQMVGAELELLAAHAGEPLHFETLYLCDLEIRSCRGCRVCFERGEEKCPLPDDMPAIKAQMDAADGILLASPVYVDDVSGLVKTWMDRVAYFCHRPGFGGKCAYALATVGGSPTSHTLRTMNGALTPTEEMERYRPEAAKVAARLFNAIVRQDALRPSFISLVAFKIQQLAWQREPPDSHDVVYWHARGWLEPGCTFYMAHRAGRLKVGLARLAGAAIARFML